MEVARFWQSRAQEAKPLFQLTLLPEPEKHTTGRQGITGTLLLSHDVISCVSFNGELFQAFEETCEESDRLS
jgi:hypothetical protein